MFAVRFLGVCSAERSCRKVCSVLHLCAKVDVGSAPRRSQKFLGISVPDGYGSVNALEDGRE